MKNTFEWMSQKNNNYKNETLSAYTLLKIYNFREKYF